MGATLSLELPGSRVLSRGALALVATRSPPGPRCLAGLRSGPDGAGPRPTEGDRPLNTRALRLLFGDESS